MSSMYTVGMCAVHVIVIRVPNHNEKIFFFSEKNFGFFGSYNTRYGTPGYLLCIQVLHRYTYTSCIYIQVPYSVCGTTTKLL